MQPWVRDRWRSLFSMLLAMRLSSIQWRVHQNSSVTTPNVPRLRCASLSRALQIFNVRPEQNRSVSAGLSLLTSSQDTPHTGGAFPLPLERGVHV
jgi:hypothetical protein